MPFVIIAANQPYFAPYFGFFEKARRADIMVVLDAVQFPRKTTWISRNRFKNDQGTLWMTVPVWKKHLGLQPINAVQICYDGRWVEKHLRSLQHAYRHAPFYPAHAPFLKETFTAGHDKLIDLNLALIRYLWHYLAIDCRLVRQSELGIGAEKDHLLVALCRNLGADTFIAQRAAQKFINPANFEAEGIRLQFFNPVATPYPQLWGDFIANLSLFDAIFNCGPKARSLIHGSDAGSDFRGPRAQTCEGSWRL